MWLIWMSKCSTISIRNERHNFFLTNYSDINTNALKTNAYE